MKAIVGLGNPGSKYQFTRHNIGFIILDAFAEKYKISFAPDKGEFYSVGSKLFTSHFYLFKPTTYMNNSGFAVKEIIDLYNIDLEDLLIIADDINLPTAKLRFRKSGGDGGHNGLSSIIYLLNSNKFNRLRFGVGNNFENGKMPEYVLDNFYENEKEIIRLGVEFSLSLIEKFIIGGTQDMMNFFSKENRDFENKLTNMKHS